MPTIAIIGALEKEVAQIKEELNGARVAQEAGLTVVGVADPSDAEDSEKIRAVADRYVETMKDIL